MREKNSSSKEYMIHTINGYKVLVDNNEFEKAYWELQKIVDLVVSTYQVDDYTPLLNSVKVPNLSKDGCQFAMNAIFEIYTDVVNLPLKQYQTENRTLTLNLDKS